MPVRKLFHSEHYADFIVEVCLDTGMSRNSVGIMMRDISDPYAKRSQRAYTTLRPEDVPALCRELRRFAKIAKEAEPPKENGNGSRY
tara:strand:- start:1091 stop:1351 length:261 start_codon:yes stop_codon:yes gene_type:complete